MRSTYFQSAAPLILVVLKCEGVVFIKRQQFVVNSGNDINDLEIECLEIEHAGISNLALGKIFKSYKCIFWHSFSVFSTSVAAQVNGRPDSRFVERRALLGKSQLCSFRI